MLQTTLNALDGQTLVYTTFVTVTILSAIIALQANGLTDEAQGILWYAVGGFVFAVGALFMGLRNHIELWISLFFGNGLLVGGMTLSWSGLRRFHGKRASLVLCAALTILCGVVALPHMPYALIVFAASTVMSIAAFSAAWSAFAPKGMTLGRWLVAIGFTVFGLGTTSRALKVVLVGVQTDPTMIKMQGPDTLKTMMIVTSLVATLWMSGFLLMIGERMREKLAHLASRDSLTGTFNRASFVELAQREWARAARSGQSIALLLVDLDHFKAVNDTYGHPTGDAVIQAFVHSAQAQIRQMDVLGRYGGEEFVILLPGANTEQALHVAERLRAAVEAAPLITSDGEAVHVTVSLGVVVSSPPALELPAMIALADEALYRAKDQGRNRVELAVATAGQARSATGR